MRRYAICSLTLVAAFQAQAQPAGFVITEGAITGAGNVSCGRYIEHRAANLEIVNQTYSSWLQGYLSAINVTYALFKKQPTQRLPDVPSILAYMDKYCRENPLKQVLEGGMALSKEL